MGVPGPRRRGVRVAAQRVIEPRAGERPVPLHRGLRGSERTCGLGHGQPREAAALHDPRLSKTVPGELGKSAVEGEHVVQGHRRRREAVREGQVSRPSAPLGPGSRPRVIDEDSPHDAGGHGEEVDAVFPVHLLNVDQTDVRFVDQRRRAQGVPGPLTGQLGGRETTKLLIDERNGRVQRIRGPGGVGPEKSRNLSGITHGEPPVPEAR